MQRFLTPLVLLMVPVAACAQKGPELGYVFPPVVQAGTKTPVVLGGYDFTPDMQLFVHDERCRIEILGPPGEFIIPPPPYWFGEKGSSPAFPIPREIPATVTVPADCPAGPVRWQVANANGASATAVFLVSDGNEVLETRDRDRPQPIDALPAAVSGRLSRIAEIDRYQIVADRDGPVTVELFARRLGADFNGVIEVRNAAGRIIADVADTEGRDAAVTFRAAAGQTYSVGLHDVDFRGNRAFVYRLAFTPGPRIVTTLPASLSAPGRQPVALDGPCVFTALLDATGTASFSWQAVKGEFWSIRAESQSLGTGLDLALSIQDSSGKQLAFSDDLQNTTDPGLEFKVPADGVYRCVLSDLSGNSGELTSIYRLTLRRAAPDYRLSVPQTVNLPVGGKTSLQIDVERLGGFNEPIAIQLRGLPEGVSASGELTVPAGKTVLKLTLEASPETPAVAGFLTVQG